MKLGNKELDSESARYIIAEVGVNHEGDLETAYKLIDAAKDGGADAVKFQTYKAESIAATDAVAYWDKNEESTESQFELFKKYDSFGKHEYRKLYEYCASKDIHFSSTPFDLEAVEWLDDLVPFFKVASADITNFPLLRAVGRKGKPVLLSTGASSLSEIKKALFELEKSGAEEICLMHCILNYPTEPANANLRMIQGLKKAFPRYTIGYSDHTRPDENMLTLTIAAELGAQVIEKHFSLDKSLPGNDHYHSMDKQDLKLFIRNLNYLNLIHGVEDKNFLDSEVPARENARRSLHYGRDVESGEVINESDLISLRPATGISPDQIDNFVGKRVKESKSRLERIKLSDFEAQN